MTGKKRYLAAKMGLLALGMALLLPGQTAEAAAKKTIYNSPYVTFSPDGKAWTTNAGDRNYSWYDDGTTVSTGIRSSLRGLQTGEHYYQYKRYGEIPIGYWRVEFRPGQCIHDGYTSDEHWHGLTYATKKCGKYYYSGWEAYCADCGEKIDHVLMYMNRAAAESIHYMDVGSASESLAYYYLCPFCNNMEQGSPLKDHECKSISWNQYKVIYEANTGSGKFSGYMNDSFHMYNNATEYEGETVTPITHLSANSYGRIGYVFTGWNTKPDGSGIAYADKAEIYNLSKADWNRQDTWMAGDDGQIILYAQWRSCQSTLRIDAAGGSYNGQSVFTTTEKYSSKYVIKQELLQAPAGYTVSFEPNGGSRVGSITGKNHFVEWMQTQPFRGRVVNGTYMFNAPDGNVDTIKASYEADPITLPSTTRTGWSFGGWYYDAGLTQPAGGAGDQITPTGNMTLYAQWIDLHLKSTDNYTANDRKGAVDLTWSQPDNNNKSYLVYQKREGGSWIRVNSSSDISSARSVSQTYTMTGSSQQYTIPYTGLYTLTAQGAQGGSYDSYTGGYGGKITGTFWLKKGEILTYTVGGQNGYNGGGAATDYGNGGGMTSIVSDQKGTLLIAGGGGGASPGGNGGDGGSAASVVTGNSGQSGMAGGGAGYQGGTAGEKIVHHHSDDCYLVTPEKVEELSQWSTGYYTWETYSETMSYKGWRAHTKGDDTAGVNLYIGSRYVQYGSYIPVNGASITASGPGIATNGAEEILLAMHWNAWGSGAGWYKDKTKITIFDQNGTAIFQKSVDDFGDPSTSDGGVWENPDGSWGGAPAVWDLSGTIHASLPEGTTNIYIVLENYFYTNCWASVDITSLKFKTPESRKLICGYEEGQVLSCKPAYGGSNYVSDQALSYTAESGVRSGNGLAELKSENIGFLDTLHLDGVTATDYAAPDQIPDNVTREAVNGSTVRITWQQPKDRGTAYYHKVDSYLTGSSSVLCTSNTTRNTLTSGIRGYYYVIDRSTSTTVNTSCAFTQNPSVNVTVSGVQYLHVAAVDVAGNLGATTHIRIAENDTQWNLYTRQLAIDTSGDNVYAAPAQKTWYVRADGRTPFTLKNEAYLDGTASTGYQINDTIYETVTDGATARNIIYTPSAAISGTDIRTEAAKLTYSTEGNVVLQQYPYSYTVRSNRNRELKSVQKFLLEQSLSGKTIQIVPVAGADRNGDKIYSDHNLDTGNKITLIADGEAPVIGGLEIMENRELIDRRDGTVTITATASDSLSGVREFYIQITNTDNAVKKTYTPGADGVIRINITADEPIFSGDFVVEAHAVDNVGNESSVSYGTTEFALKSSVKRILEPHDPVFKRGESGILTITTWGYADRVEVIFPESMTRLDPTLNRVYDYTNRPGYSITEEQQFMIPLYMEDNAHLEITVRAYKGGKQLEDHPEISVISVGGTVLDEIRTRLR